MLTFLASLFIRGHLLQESFSPLKSTFFLLTLKVPSKIAADDALFFFFYLLKKIRLDISCESSA